MTYKPDSAVTHINQATVDLVKRFEGLELTSYRDSVGVWTIGYGTTSRAGLGVTVSAGMTITQGQAEDYLRRGLEKFAKSIWPAITAPTTANEFGAMLSLAYNIGPTAFKKSTCLRRFNAGDTAGAAEALTWFNKAGGKTLPGLVRRRQAEHDLMLTDAPVVATPTADPERGRSESKTMRGVLATAAAYLAGNVETVKSFVGEYSELIGITPQQLFGALVLVGLAFLLWERNRKFAAGDR